MMWLVLAWWSILGEIFRFEIAGLSVRLIDVWAGVMVLSYWLMHVRKSWRQSIWLWGVAGIVLLSWWGRWSAGEPLDLPGVLYAARVMVYLSLIPIVQQLASQAQLGRIWGRSIDWLFVVMLLTGWLQYLLLPDLHFLYQFGYDPHLFRMTGFWWDPNFFGLMLLLIWWWFLPQVYTFFTKADWWKNWKAWVGLLCMISIGLTYSRASYLTWLLLTLAVVQLLRWRRVGLIWFALAGLIYWLLPRAAGEGVNLARTSTVVARLDSWQQALTAWSYAPLTGVGFNFFRFQSVQADASRQMHALYGVDNSWLLILATTGLAGAAYVWHLIYQFFFGRVKQFFELLDYPGNLSEAKESGWWWPIMGGLSLLTMLIGSSFSNALFYPPLMVWWTSLVGLSLGKVKKL